MKNANLKKDPITTAIGVIMIVLSIAMAGALFIDYVEYELTKAIIDGALLVLGVLFLLSPDSLVRGANKVVDKGTDKL